MFASGSDGKRTHTGDRWHIGNHRRVATLLLHGAMMSTASMMVSKTIRPGSNPGCPVPEGLTRLRRGGLSSAPYNPASRFSRGRGVVVAQEPSKLLGRVRFPSPASIPARCRNPVSGPAPRSPWHRRSRLRPDRPREPAPRGPRLAAPGKVQLRAGAWRSLVAHSTGGRKVAGSNPVAPILFSRDDRLPRRV